jgi:hypothetical protein
MRPARFPSEELLERFSGVGRLGDGLRAYGLGFCLDPPSREGAGADSSFRSVSGRCSNTTEGAWPVCRGVEQ